MASCILRQDYSADNLNILARRTKRSHSCQWITCTFLIKRVRFILLWNSKLWTKFDFCSLKNSHLHLGRVSNNQNGNLRWFLPLGVESPPLNGTNFRTFFYPTFFFCNGILHIWNGFYTSKISFLSPLIIGSKLTFISISGRWLPTI